MSNTCDVLGCDKPPFNSITIFGVRRLKQPGLHLCREHDKEIQEKIVELVNGYLEHKSVNNQGKRS